MDDSALQSPLLRGLSLTRPRVLHEHVVAGRRRLDSRHQIGPHLLDGLALRQVATVDAHLGAIGRPKRLHFLGQLPKTRSGKILRRAIQAIAEGREPGDLTTLDDPIGIQAVRNAIAVEI
jgi:hypothetical protein